MVAEQDGKNNTVRYVRGLELLSSDSECARTYYHYASDELGSITHVTDINGKVLNHYVYDAFGNRTVKEETVQNRFGFTGEICDGLTGQYYLRARFYNPVIGRFLNEDTYYGDGLNLYDYCHNNPVNYVDPSGHSCEGKQAPSDKHKEHGNSEADATVEGTKDSKKYDPKKPLSSSNYPNPDPDYSQPPVRYDPKTPEELKRMQQGKGPTTKKTAGDRNIEAHHRGQKSTEKGGIIDEIEEYSHRRGGNHTRHDLPSELTPKQRAKEIREHYKNRAKEYEIVNGKVVKISKE